VWVNIVNQTFESEFPGPWTLFDNTGGAYFFGKRDCEKFAGTFGGWAVGGGTAGSALGCGSNYPADNTVTAMIYGPFSLEGEVAAEFLLKAWYNTESYPEPGASQDWVRWCASPDGVTFYCYQVSGDSDGWTDLALDLGAAPAIGSLLGDQSVWVMVQFESDLNITLPGGLYVDNVKVRRCMANCDLVMPIEALLNWKIVVIEK
jgi:hypothetical protein